MNISPFEKKSAPSARPMDELAGAAVLVVEDERDLAEEIRLELQSSGHPVRLAETVDDGLRGGAFRRRGSDRRPDAARRGWAFDHRNAARRGQRDARPGD